MRRARNTLLAIALLPIVAALARTQEKPNVPAAPGPEVHPTSDAAFVKQVNAAVDKADAWLAKQQEQDDPPKYTYEVGLTLMAFHAGAAPVGERQALDRMNAAELARYAFPRTLQPGDKEFLEPLVVRLTKERYQECWSYGNYGTSFAARKRRREAIAAIDSQLAWLQEHFLVAENVTGDGGNGLRLPFGGPANAVIDTCFALLFLKRATLRGSVTGDP